MKKSLMLLSCLLFVSASSIASDESVSRRESGAVEIRAMTFNIRTLDPTDGLDFWFFRRDAVAGLIKEHEPDFIGMQEAFTIQARGLERRLPDYDWFGAGRGDGGKKGERCPIFYRGDRFELLDHDTFWLSETPDEPSKSWDSALKRIVTWGKFRERETGEVFFLFNTHFDHMGVVARRKSAEVISGKVNEIAGDAPAVITGDFNTTDKKIPYKTLTSLLQDSMLITSTPPQGPEGTSRGFNRDSKPKKRIDYIFLSQGIRAQSYAVLDDTYKKGRRPSDHMPVLVNLELP